jgi:hypothetical protein
MKPHEQKRYKIRAKKKGKQRAIKNQIKKRKDNKTLSHKSKK